MIKTNWEVRMANDGMAWIFETVFQWFKFGSKMFEILQKCCSVDFVQAEFALWYRDLVSVVRFRGVLL